MITSSLKNDCGVCSLRTLPVLRGVAKGTWSQFLRLRTSRLYSRGNILFYEGNQPLGMYFLCRGRVKIVKSDFGQRSHISRVVEAPDLLGDRSFIAGQPYVGTGEVMEESRVCFLGASHFDRLFLGEPGVRLDLARRFARELGQAEEKARDLALKTIRARLAKLLLERLAAQTASKGHAVALSLKESRLELAEIIGTSPEAVCRSLAEFRSKGLIAAQGRSVRILDERRLRQVAEL